MINQLSYTTNSNYVRLVMQVNTQEGFSIECIEGLLDIALANYQLLTKKHELNFSKLLEIWERDCSHTLPCWNLAA
tara:strand:+ start:1599 stop:1826 length:228 start_codon:yes stop_codon:yes gene_type:complete